MNEPDELAREDLSRFFELCPNPLCIVDREGRFRRLNGAWERALGYPRDELVGQRYIDLVHPDDIERTAAQGTLAEHELLVAPFTNRLRSLDGSYRRLLWSSAPDPNRGLIYAAARDVTEAWEARELAESMRTAAERASEEKSMFLSRMSHELRTPLNAILGFAQLLELEGTTPAQADSVQQILKAGQHLLELINEVLDISRIETGRLQLSPEPVDLPELARETIVLLEPLAQARKVRLELDAEQSVAHGLADRQRLKQVLLNLISNAIKYNRSNGSVRISYAQTNHGRVRVSVTDSGLGIAGDDIERLFVPFDRLGAEATEIEGTGLGLALSQRLVEAMGGRISVESTIGVGSTFAVELPATDSPLDRAQPLLDRIAHASSEQTSRPRRILYIEDNLLNLRLIERVLAQHNVELLSAMQATLGLELAREHRPDLILLDLHLPDLDGEEVLRRLRGDERTQAIPVIILSADATPGQIERLRQLGADSYLTKPLNLRSFLDTLERALVNHPE